MVEADDRVVRIWCGPDDPPRGKKSLYGLRLNSIRPSENVHLKSGDISKRLTRDLNGVCHDLLEIAAYVYSADQSKTRGGSTFPKSGENWYRQFELSIPVRDCDFWSAPVISEKLAELLCFMSDDQYRFAFRPLRKDVPRPSYFEFDEGKPWFEPGSILLFSGGLDSLTGAVEELQDGNRKLLLVSHRPVSKIDHRQRELITALKEKFNGRGRILHVPVWVNKDKGITKDANQRTRSFLYASLAAAVANMTGLKEIKFYENGIVSCNLPVSEQVVGARASRTTHPKTLRIMSDLFTAIFGSDFGVVNPFFSKTKSDVIAALNDCGGQELISLTHSCTKTMSSTLTHPHCGTCSQCIERRLAVLYNSSEDSDPEEKYRTRLFPDSIWDSDERVMVGSYIQHARKLEEAGIDDFFDAFPDAISLVGELGITWEEAGEMVYNLHHRHGLQVARVVKTQIERHSDQIRKRQIPSNSLLDMVVGKREVARGDAEVPKRFPTPRGATWKEIEIDIDSGETIVVRTRGVTRKYHASDVGFRDNRMVDRFTGQWELMEAFAQNGGRIGWGSGGARKRWQKDIQKLNKLLRTFFGLSSNPIARYSRKDGWVAKFQIRDTSYGKS